jgi:hypothetical protein
MNEDAKISKALGFKAPKGQIINSNIEFWN